MKGKVKDAVRLARPVRLKAELRGVVCAKCVRRAGEGGKGAGKRLTKALRRLAGVKRVQAAECSCLGLCPKRHIVVVPLGGPPHLVPSKDWRDHAARLLANQEGLPSVTE